MSWFIIIRFCYKAWLYRSSYSFVVVVVVDCGDFKNFILLLLLFGLQWWVLLVMFFISIIQTSG